MVDLKMSVYDLGTGVTKLGSISSSTVSNFRSSSYTVIQELQAACEYLLDGFEDEAVDCLEALTTTAKEMAAEANSLKNKFEEKIKEVRDTIEKLEKMENERGESRTKEENKQKEFQAEIKQYEEEKEKLKLLEEEAKKKKDKYEQKRDEEIDNFEEPSLIRVVYRKITGTKDPRKEKAAEWQKKSIEQYEIEKKQRELYSMKLEQELKSFSALESCKVIEGDLSTAIKCLQTVISALQHLASVMSAAVEFWEHLERECGKLSGSKIQQAIQKGKQKGEEDRIDLWYSPGFKRQAVHYCSKWVALHSICHDYIENVKLVQEELRSYNTENPSLEKAQEMLPLLIEELKKDTIKLRSDNGRYISEADSKIKEIQSGSASVDEEENNSD